MGHLFLSCQLFSQLAYRLRFFEMNVETLGTVFLNTDLPAGEKHL